MVYDGKEFGQWLRRQRKARDLTQRTLARRIGCSESTLRKFEAGTRRPSRELVELLTEFFGSEAAEQARVMEWARLGAGAPAGEAPAPTPATNLPARLTPLRGREHELAAIQRSLEAGAGRLLTITGPPGVGKTRLAVQAAARVLPAFPDGVFFVGLALVRDPTLVPATIAQVLGLRQAGPQAAVTQLAAALLNQRLLLVLDNFEQVPSAAPTVVDLLEACPALQALVTSREALHVHGEQQLELLPLRVPDLERAASPADVLGYPAVALFSERARAVQPDFEVSAENAATVARICARLDGLPLAIELAAARIRLLSPAAMLARLDHRLALLTGGARNLPPRHQTLRHAIDWSYDLLQPAEQVLFARLAVFAGGGTLDAVEVIAGSDLGAGEALPPLVILQALLDQSLLARRLDGGDEPRFFMLETIREYAHEQLVRRDEVATLQTRHAQYYLAWAEAVAQQLPGAEEKAGLDRLEQEYDNLRAVLDWAQGQGAHEPAARMMVALLRFWDLRGYWSEGRRRLEAVLRQAGDTLPAPVRAAVALGAGRFAGYQDDYTAAQRFTTEGLHQATLAGDQPGMAAALNGLAFLAATQGDRATATRLLEESLAVSRAIDDTRNVAKTLGNLGRVAMDSGDYGHAFRLQHEALALFRRLRDKWGLVGVLESLGQLAAEQGEYDQAIALLEESLALSRALGDKGHLAWVLGDLGIALLAAGAYARAVAASAEALRLFLELGDQHGRALSLGIQGVSLAYAGEHPQAAAGLRKSIGVWLEIGDGAGCALGLEGLAWVAAATDDAQRAGTLAGVAARLRAASGYKVHPVERPLHEQLVARFGAPSAEHTFQAALAAGQRLEWDQALAYAQAEAAGFIKPAPSTG